jgi:cytidyltransferase-like protein
MTIAMISGGFDPVHIGHCDLINSAAKYGRLVVALNSDEWLIRKKGYNFMSWDDRKTILLQMENVSYVTTVDDADDTVCEALRRIRPDYFVNGGDRQEGLKPESSVCTSMGIKEIFCGGGKVRSSSEIVRAALYSAMTGHGE